MLTINPQMQEGLIRDYIIHLRRERNLSPATVNIPSCNNSFLRNERRYYKMEETKENSKQSITTL